MEPGPPLRHNPRSTASIAGHPIHPMPISFPIATFACDVPFAITRSTGWLSPTMSLPGAG
ncbi:MAG: hypothetical protein ACREE1_11130 [Stellaceae bacterium]